MVTRCLWTIVWSLAVASVAGACAEPDATRVAVEPEAIAQASAGSGPGWDARTALDADGFRLRPLDGDFRIPTPNGEDIVCGAYEIVGRDGRVASHEVEWYPVATMNRLLEGAGTDQAVAHVDEAFVAMLRERGVDRIESCDDARAYSDLAEERMSMNGLSAEELLSQHGLPPDFAVQADDELVEKVINGVSFDQASTVGLTIPIPLIPGFTKQGCTGTLIGAFAMLTAAHCFPSGTGFHSVYAQIRPGGGTPTCISHTPKGDGTCPVGEQDFLLNAYVQVHPKYDGTANYDQAVVISGNWLAPANSASRWTRIPANILWPLIAALRGSPLELVGYGFKNTSKQGGGIGRRGHELHVISDWGTWGSNTFGVRREQTSSSAGCKGDSGAGLYSYTLLPNRQTIALGLVSRDPNPDVVCSPVGSSTVYTIPDATWVENAVEFFGGSCTTQTDSATGAKLLRCF